MLLIRRKNEPFAGSWALPGGFIEIDEPVEAAARRELREETGLGLAATGPVEFLGVYGDPGRDPRGRTISIAYAATVREIDADVAGGDDAAEAAWRDPEDCRGLAFDHDAILADARDWLSRGVAEGRLGLALLPDEFGDVEVSSLHRALGMPQGASADWREKMVRAGRIVPTGTGTGRFRSAID